MQEGDDTSRLAEVSYAKVSGNVVWHGKSMETHPLAAGKRGPYREHIAACVRAQVAGLEAVTRHPR